MKDIRVTSILTNAYKAPRGIDLSREGDQRCRAYRPKYAWSEETGLHSLGARRGPESLARTHQLLPLSMMVWMIGCPLYPILHALRVLLLHFLNLQAPALVSRIGR